MYPKPKGCSLQLRFLHTPHDNLRHGMSCGLTPTHLQYYSIKLKLATGKYRWKGRYKTVYEMYNTKQGTAIDKEMQLIRGPFVLIFRILALDDFHLFQRSTLVGF